MKTSTPEKISIIGLTILTLLIIGYSFVPSVRTAINEHRLKIKQVDEETSYKNRKSVEDSARALLTNYDSAKSEYETYKQFIGTEDKAKEQRALDAQTSANMTVAKYNNYLTENQFVFKGNLPNDIPLKLEKVGE